MAEAVVTKGLSFAEAVAYAESRKVVLPDEYYGKLAGIQRSQAVSVAGLASIEQVKFVVDQVAKVLKDGGTFADFQRAVKAGDLNIDLPKYRLDNIFRTNVQAAYSRGRWEQQTRAAGSRPYLMYDAINDSRTRPAHHAMDNIILPRDDPWWAIHYPPNGYRCRCTVISLTAKQAEKRGITQLAPDTSPDKGWDYNPGTDYVAPVTKLLDAEVVAALKKPTAVVDKVVHDPTKKKAAKTTPQVAQKTADTVTTVKARAEAVGRLADLFNLQGGELADFKKKLQRLVRDQPKAAGVDSQVFQFLYSYTGAGYEKIQQFLRTADANDFVVQEMLAQLQDAVGRAAKFLPSGVRTVHRGSGIPDVAEFLRTHKPGETIQTKGFLSSSTVPAVARLFAEDAVDSSFVIYKIQQEGSPGINLTEFSNNLTEAEVLFPPGQVFEVVSAEPLPGENGYQVTLKAVKAKKANHTFSYEARMGGHLADSAMSATAFAFWMRRALEKEQAGQ